MTAKCSCRYNMALLVSVLIPPALEWTCSGQASDAYWHTAAALLSGWTFDNVLSCMQRASPALSVLSHVV